MTHNDVRLFGFAPPTPVKAAQVKGEGVPPFFKLASFILVLWVKLPRRLPIFGGPHPLTTRS